MDKNLLETDPTNGMLTTPLNKENAADMGGMGGSIPSMSMDLGGGAGAPLPPTPEMGNARAQIITGQPNTAQAAPTTAGTPEAGIPLTQGRILHGMLFYESDTSNISTRVRCSRPVNEIQKYVTIMEDRKKAIKSI